MKNTKDKLVIENKMLADHLAEANKELEKIRFVVSEIERDLEDESLNVMVNAKDTIKKLHALEVLIINSRHANKDILLYVIHRAIDSIRSETERGE